MAVVSDETAVPTASNGQKAPLLARRLPRPGAVTVLLALYGAAAGAALYYVARDAMPDDAYTTFAYARTLAEHGVWGVYPDVPANTATSPLNVWLLAVGVLVLGSAPVSAGVLLAVTLAAAAVWLHRLAGPAAAVAGVLLLVGCPITNSAVGMEVYLGLTLMLGLAYHARASRWWVAGILAGLLALTRADLAPVAAVIVLVMAPRRAAPVLGLGAVIALPFSLWAWFARGSFLPDTMAVKSVMAEGRDKFPFDYGYYADNFPVAVHIAEATVLVGLVALVVALTRPNRAGAAIGAGALVNAASFAATGAGITYYYYSTLVAGLGLCAVLVATQLLRAWNWRPNIAAARGALLVAPALLVIAAGLVLAVGRGAPWTDGFAPIRFNWATTAQYKAIADTLPPGVVETISRKDVGGGAEIGVLAYFAPPGTRVVEFLADPGRTAEYIARWREQHPGLVEQLNYAHYQRPTPLTPDWLFVYSTETRPGWTPISTVDIPKSVHLERGPVLAPTPPS
jgi:hypothetical protein